jgi:fibronectin type 3 domain-containing protein
MADIRRVHVLLLCVSLLLALGLMAGCDSDDKRPAAPAVDTVPPAIPDGLAATVQQGSVLLAWDANVTDPDLAGYVIYRSLREDAGYAALLSVPVNTNAWEDDTVQKGHSYYYRVAAVDAAGNESGVSFAFRVVIADDSSNRHDQLSD